MKRKFLSILLTLAMALTLLPTAAMADETPVEAPAETKVAQIGDVKYDTLQAAVDAAPRKATVKLLADTKENVTIGTPYVTLDLNGHTLNGSTGERKPALTITARVTVMDSSEAQTGTIMREDTAENSGVSSHYVIDVQGSGWLTFESGTVKNGSGAGGTKGASLVRVGDDSVAKYPGLTIKGGTFTQDNFIVIKVDRGDLFLNGGTLESAHSYAVENWFRATIKGGTVNGAVSSWTYSGGSKSTLEISGGTVNGDVTSVNYGDANKVAKVAITGGTVTGDLDTRSYDPTTGKLTSINDAAKSTIEVTGGTFSSNPTKYVVENSSVTKNDDGTYGVAKAYLAKVGETSYYTMDDAFHAAVASGETLTLLCDYTTASLQNSGSKSFTIDLNGHTWTYTSKDTNSAAFEINYPDVTLTVKNGKIVSSQLVGLIPSAMGGTITYDNSGLVFENIEATANATSGIETNGNNTNDSVTLKNSTLNVPNGFGIYFPSSGTLTIDNSTINAKTMGVQVCAGSLSINAGSAITVSGDAVPKTENDGAIQDGAAISIVNRIGYKGLGKIAVTGGTFTAKSGNAAIKAYNWQNQTESNFNASDKVSVSGGTFTSEVPKNCCAPGFVPKANSDDTYGVEINEDADMAAEVLDAQGNTVGAYDTLADAITAAKNGETVKLLKDVTENVSISRNLVLDLNGKTLTGKDLVNKNKKHERIALTANAGKVEVKNGIIDGRVNAYDSADLTIDADVTVKNSYNGSGYDCFGIVVWGDGTFGQNGCQTPKLTVNGKVIMEKGGVAISTNGTDKSCAVVTINDGAVISTTEDGAIYLPSGKLTMNGGTVSGPTGIQICAGTADITADFKLNKGTVTATGTDQRTSKGTGDGLIPDGAAISVVNRNYPNGVPSVTINGGSFSSVNSDAVLAYKWSEGTASEWTDAKTYVKINDGYFTSDPSAYVVNNGSANIVKRDGSEGAYTYTVLARSSLTSGVYLTDPSGALASNYYVSSTANGVWTVSYSAPSSGGGSSSSSRRYDVSAPSVKHGDVTVSPKTASKGDTVTITVKPDSGYELDTLTVKDASGSKIKVKDKGDGKFTFTMPASKVTVSAEFAEIETLDFADVSTDAYYYEAVKWAAKKGITGGTGDGTFNPNGSCTRAHIVTFLWRAAGSPEPKSTVSFADVPAGSYYAKAVAWAVENGITLGTGDGTFSPNATCTRAQSVTFLYRALGTAPTTVNGFTDVTADAFYADAVAWAVESGVTNGTTDSTFSPNNGCTRAQIVTFLYRTMK